MKTCIAIVCNYPLMSALLAMIIAQALKIVYYFVIDKKLDWHHLFESGGMPSSHAALAGALAVAVGLREGWCSSQFAISVAFASIVMYDAVGVRRATGKASLILNRILEDLYKSGRIGNERLHEFTGHTPLEVAMGLLLGIAVAVIAFIGGLAVAL
jgi:uncharacterized protein